LPSDLDHVSAGQSFAPTAETWNAFIDAAVAHRGQKLGREGGEPRTRALVPSTRCRVKYDASSVSTLSAFSVLSYGSALVDPSTDLASRLFANASPTFTGATPTAATVRRPFVVTAAPIQGGAIGEAIAHGLAVVQVEITSAAHTRAKPIVGSTAKLTSCSAGGVPIVWSESGTGTKWAIVMLDFGETESASDDATAAPCAGSCTWSYSSSTKLWSSVTNTCSTNCNCYYPDFCPTCSGSQTTITACFRNVSGPGNHPQCNTTTTTTAPPGCTGTCTWKSYPTLGWVQTSGSCLSTCPCAMPAGTGPMDCGVSGPGTVETPCVSPPPPPPCSGNCLWVYGDATTGWILRSNNCAGGGPGGCFCSAPVAAGAVCGSEQYTPCVGEAQTGTTTTAPPMVCTGRCYWCWSGSAWVFDRADGCIGCLCPQPDYSGSATGEVGIASCASSTTTTTTTTTTTSTTSTTTTSTTTTQRWCCLVVTECLEGGAPTTCTVCPPIGNQLCLPCEDTGAPETTPEVGESLTLYCSAGQSATALITAIHSSWDPGCAENCTRGTTTTTSTTTTAPTTTAPTTTTTSTTSTTTTSTTTTAASDWYCWCCAGNGVCNPTNPGGCTQLSGPHADAIACTSSPCPFFC